MKFNEIIDDVKDSINDTKSKVVKAVDDAELDKRAKEFGNVAGDKLKSIDISISHCKEYAVATVVAVVED